MHKNQNFFILFFLFVFAASAFLVIPGTEAATEGLQYTLLEKIPGAETISGSDLPHYIENIYRVALIIVVLSAVLMLSIGGFMYLTSARNTSALGTAKSVIFDSLIGLVIALAAWLVLNVINPDLVSVTLNGLSPVAVPGRGVPAAPGVPAAGTYTHAEAVDALNGITVTSTTGCLGQDAPGCTTLEGIPKSTVSNILAFKNKTGCAIAITGATEKSGHSATTNHGPNSPVVDIDENECLKNKLLEAKTSGTLGSQYLISNICAQQSSQAVAYSCRHVEPNSHLHIQFQS